MDDDFAAFDKKSNIWNIHVEIENKEQPRFSDVLVIRDCTIVGIWIIQKNSRLTYKFNLS